MKVTIDKIEEMTIAEFADRNGLTMKLVERPDAATPDPKYRWYASFENSELKEGSFLSSVYGDGATPQEAIENYRVQLKSGDKLVINAYLDSRREIILPRLLPSTENLGDL